MLDLRGILAFLSLSAVSGTNMTKKLFSKFLKNKMKECIKLLKEIGRVPSCYQNMSLEMDVFLDHKPMSTKCYRSPPSSKVKKVEGRSEKDKMTITNKPKTRSKKGKFKVKVAAV